MYVNEVEKIKNQVKLGNISQHERKHARKSIRRSVRWSITKAQKLTKDIFITKYSKKRKNSESTYSIIYVESNQHKASNQFF